MHPAQLAERIKNLPDEVLMQEMQRPSGAAPSYVILGELERRQALRKKFAQGGQVQHFSGGGRSELDRMGGIGAPINLRGMYTDTAELNSGPTQPPPGMDIETWRALEEIKRRKRPWYQMGPENTFLTPERVKASAGIYGSPRPTSAMRERGAGYEPGNVPTPVTPVPNQPGVAAPPAARAGIGAVRPGPQVAAPPVSAGPYPEAGPVRAYAGQSSTPVEDQAPYLASMDVGSTALTGASSPAAAGIGAVAPTSKRPDDFAAYMKQAEDANPDGIAGMREKYMAMMDQQKTSKEDMVNNAMLKAGIGMMNTKSSRFLSAAGEGAASALMQYEHDLRGNKDTDKARLAAGMDFAKYGATRAANINKTARELRAQDITDDRWDRTFAQQSRTADIAASAERNKGEYYKALAENAKANTAQLGELRSAQAEKAKADAGSNTVRANAAAARAGRSGAGGGSGGTDANGNDLKALAIAQRVGKTDLEAVSEAYERITGRPLKGGASGRSISYGDLTGGKAVPRAPNGQEIKRAY